MRFRGWSRTPMSKPLAFMGAMLTVAVVGFCLAKDRDIPPYVADLLMCFDTLTIGGYVGKSAIENNWGHGEMPRTKEREDGDRYGDQGP